MSARLRARFYGPGVRQLGDYARDLVSDTLAIDPVGSCLVAARFEAAGMDRRALGGSFWGSPRPGGGLSFVGSNIVPVAGDAAAMQELGSVLHNRGRRFASIVGRSELVEPLWDSLRLWWGTARDVRTQQPLMICPDPPLVAADRRVGTASTRQLNQYFPAAVAMFTEEIGVDPTIPDDGASYRERVRDLVASRRAFVIFDHDSVVFKAEVGSLSSRVGLIQGVWVDPRWRGRGIAAPATAAVVRAVQRWGRLPALYVNSYNAPALATYRRVGFTTVGSFTSVLF